MNEMSDLARLKHLISTISAIDRDVLEQAWKYQENLTKPVRSLATLEDYGNQLCAIAGQVPPPPIDKGLVAVFAADHGCALKTSPWPQEITSSMAANIYRGGASVAVLARGAGADVRVVDLGILKPLNERDDLGVEEDDRFANMWIKAGTEDMTEGPAMTEEEALKAIIAGIETADWAADRGYSVLITGEVGIGNTSPASALISVFSGKPIDEIVGWGSDTVGSKFEKKRAALRQVFEVNHPDPNQPLQALAMVGGFEHAATAGFILGAAARRLPVLLDGVIGCSGAMVAAALCPDSVGYMYAGHVGKEPGIKAAIDSLGLEPMLQLGLCLGEGSGAVLALPILRQAANIMLEVTKFDEAGVSPERE